MGEADSLDIEPLGKVGQVRVLCTARENLVADDDKRGGIDAVGRSHGTGLVQKPVVGEAEKSLCVSRMFWCPPRWCGATSDFWRMSNWKRVKSSPPTAPIPAR